MFLLKTDQTSNNLFIISAQERLGVVSKQKKIYPYRQISKNELKNSGILDKCASLVFTFTSISFSISFNILLLSLSFMGCA